MSTRLSWKAGQKVRVSCGGSAATGHIKLASENSKSLAVLFDDDAGLSIGGGMMLKGLALLLDGDCTYRELFSGEPVVIEERA